MFLVWNVSILIVKQNDCKNKTTCLSHTTYIEDIKTFFKGLFFCSKIVYFKRFSNETVFKSSKNMGLKIVNDPKMG